MNIEYNSGVKCPMNECKLVFYTRESMKEHMKKHLKEKKEKSMNENLTRLGF